MGQYVVRRQWFEKNLAVRYIFYNALKVIFMSVGGSRYPTRAIGASFWRPMIRTIRRFWVFFSMLVFWIIKFQTRIKPWIEVTVSRPNAIESAFARKPFFLRVSFHWTFPRQSTRTSLVPNGIVHFRCVDMDHISPLEIWIWKLFQSPTWANAREI